VIPLVIPEVGANHDGDLGKAHRLIDAISSAGAECVKFQYFRADDLLIADGPEINWTHGGQSRSQHLHALFTRLALSKESLADLFSHAIEAGLTPLATPFSCAGVMELAELGSPFIKVASSDVSAETFLACVAETGLPILLSTGKATLSEVDEAIGTLERNNAGPITLLHCVAAYPTPAHEVNLEVMSTLRAAFPECEVGFSDHTYGIHVALAAIALGARTVEKHVTLDKSGDGPDHAFSIDPQELTDLVVQGREVSESIGTGRKRVRLSESGGRHHGIRSLVAIRDLPAGHIVASGDLEELRPGWGIRPRNLKDVLGMVITSHVGRGEPLTWDALKALSPAPPATGEAS
jgi:N,N'-diacetyllegionaminate synthase